MIREMVTSEVYEQYQAKSLEFVEGMLQGTACRPVLFLGSGISRRIIGAPSWMELLAAIANRIGLADDHFTFLSQKAGNEPIQLGTLLSDEVHQWAWASGKNNFPAEYFSKDYDKSIFIKKLAADILVEIFHSSKSAIANSPEVKLLKSVSPHAIITTNFDPLIDEMFPDYELIVGEKIIPMSMNIMGELYKIHGSTNDPSSLVLTEQDYQRFTKKRRYISAKMMTYFAEYPVFVFGYGLGDTNVNSIISDLGEALKERGGMLDNVCYVEWVEDVSKLKSLKEEHAIAVGGDAESALRLKTIVTDDLSWVFKALNDYSSPYPVNTKILRQLAARVVNIVRVDAPQNNLEINYKHIENLNDNPEELAMVLGIGNSSNANLSHPYVLTQVGNMLGYKGWYRANQLLIAAKEKYGRDIKSVDDELHIAIKTGKTSVTHKYSAACVDYLKGVREKLKGEGMI
ncbi:SIR2 family protein [uncultured Brevundimonas sp.]|uniref:SIR2 family protein n=1 Tax=uncultured Brevundimonas sp. TaxID=213418 RepID=UPI0025EE9399|nr:SIR2 family protein [uncultured Brevundimonas sp.]